ncbi:hypothetical protein ACFSTI_22750 [Rhizorhabdus histidinilytica]
MSAGSGITTTSAEPIASSSDSVGCAIATSRSPLESRMRMLRLSSTGANASAPRRQNQTSCPFSLSSTAAA